jgi:hypothetical protein
MWLHAERAVGVGKLVFANDTLQLWAFSGVEKNEHIVVRESDVVDVVKGVFFFQHDPGVAKTFCVLDKMIRH